MHKPTYATLNSSIYSNELQIEQVQSGESFDNVSERVTYHFFHALPGGSKAELRIGFSGEITRNMTGYYRSSWDDEGKKKFYALTHFEVSQRLETDCDCY